MSAERDAAVDAGLTEVEVLAAAKAIQRERGHRWEGRVHQGDCIVDARAALGAFLAARRAPAPVAGRGDADVEAVLAKAAAEHYYFALDPSRCGGCGEHLPCVGEVDDEHRAHVAAVQAAALVPLLAVRERAAKAEALTDLTDDEAEQIDFQMSEHMYRHSISNNVNGMSCDPRCRTQGLAFAVNQVFRERAASYADQPAEGAGGEDA